MKNNLDNIYAPINTKKGLEIRYVGIQRVEWYPSPFWNFKAVINLESFSKELEESLNVKGGVPQFFFFSCKKEQQFKKVNIRMYASDINYGAGRDFIITNTTTLSEQPEILNDIILSTSSKDIKTVKDEEEGSWFFDITHNKKLIKRILDVKSSVPSKYWKVEINLTNICDKSIKDIDACFKEFDLKNPLKEIPKLENKVFCNSGVKEIIPVFMNTKTDFEIKYSTYHLKIALNAYINSDNIELLDVNSSIITRDKYPIKAINIFLRDVDDNDLTTITCTTPKFVKYESDKSSDYNYLLRLVNTIEEAKELLEYIKDVDTDKSITVQMIPLTVIDGKTPEEIKEIEFRALELKYKKAKEARKKTDCRIF